MLFLPGNAQGMMIIFSHLLCLEFTEEELGS